MLSLNNVVLKWCDIQLDTRTSVVSIWLSNRRVSEELPFLERAARLNSAQPPVTVVPHRKIPESLLCYPVYSSLQRRDLHNGARVSISDGGDSGDQLCRKNTTT